MSDGKLRHCIGPGLPVLERQTDKIWLLRLASYDRCTYLFAVPVPRFRRTDLEGPSAGFHFQKLGFGLLLDTLAFAQPTYHVCTSHILVRDITLCPPSCSPTSHIGRFSYNSSLRPSNSLAMPSQSQNPTQTRSNASPPLHRV